MTDLSKLGIGLTVAFVFSFVALVTELCYIFFRRRKRVLDEESDDISSNSWSTKEFFYFFCCRNKSGIELTGAPTTVHPVDDDNVMEQSDDELAKWQELHGPSRILYTIKEEEKEDLESEKSSSERKSKKRVCSSSIEEEKEISVVVISVESDRETETPYLTPCGSPPYCTPMSSPPRDQNLMYYLESENCYVLEVEKSQRRSLSSSEKCFPVIGKSNGRGS